MVTLNLFVEGGGDNANLKIKCRRGFSEFIKKANIQTQPKIIACGSRENAFASYSTAIKNGKRAMLLVDSESKVDAAFQSGSDHSHWQPWKHLKLTDKWIMPPNADDLDCHLMVEVMENWFLADPSTLKEYFGSQFKHKEIDLKKHSIELCSKDDCYKLLKNATKLCKPKGYYRKADHSFDLLAKLSADKVMVASPWAYRFITTLKDRLT